MTTGEFGGDYEMPSGTSLAHSIMGQAMSMQGFDIFLGGAQETAAPAPHQNYEPNEGHKTVPTREEYNGETSGDVPTGNAHDDWDHDGVPTGVRLQQELSHISETIRQLNCTLAGLPYLDHRSFIWPETEDQYAMKEELEEAMVKEVERLSGYMPVLERRVQQCQENLGRIEADAAKLHRKEPEEHYTEAQDTQRKRCFNALHDKDSASIVLAEAQVVLAVSRKKKFPGREPARQFPFPGAKPGDMPRDSQGSGSQTRSDKPTREMDRAH